MEAVHGHRSLEVSYPVSVTWWVCAGGPLVPAVHMCAEQAAERGELVPCTCGQEANLASRLRAGAPRAERGEGYEGLDAGY